MTREEKTAQFIAVWNQAQSVAEVAEYFGVRPNSARRRAFRWRRRGLDVKHMPLTDQVGPGLPVLRKGMRVRHGERLGTVIKPRIKRPPRGEVTLIQWDDGTVGETTRKGRIGGRAGIGEDYLEIVE